MSKIRFSKRLKEDMQFCHNSLKVSMLVYWPGVSGVLQEGQQLLSVPQVSGKHRILPEDCRSKTHATQSADCGHAESRWGLQLRDKAKGFLDGGLNVSCCNLRFKHACFSCSRVAPQCPSPVWILSSSCVSTSVRKTFWWNLRQMSRGAVTLRLLILPSAVTLCHFSKQHNSSGTRLGGGQIYAGGRPAISIILQPQIRQSFSSCRVKTSFLHV